MHDEDDTSEHREPFLRERQPGRMQLSDCIRFMKFRKSVNMHMKNHQECTPIYPISRNDGIFFVSSNKHPVAITVILSELTGCATLFLFKEAVKIGDIIKPAIVGNLCNRFGGINQQAGSVS